LDAQYEKKDAPGILKIRVMANRRVEEEVERLGRLRDGGRGEALTAAVRKALADRVGLVTAKAARIAAEMRMEELLPDLLRAFDRLFEKPVERDPQCWGKNAIAKALTELDYRQSAPFLRGARHVQMEPVWGGQEDTASVLRGICVLGLVSCSDVRREQVLRCLLEALTEKAQTVRLEAVRAIAEMGGDEAPLLLRLKARVGDQEPPVAGQVFDSLLRLEGREAIPFVAAFLETGNGEVRAEAALALGSSRMPEAEEALEAAWEQTRDPDLRDALARAISASRQPRAFDFLLAMVKNGRASDAGMALEALAIHRESPEIWKRVEEMVREAGSGVQQAFRNLRASSG
jgi:HEAT repeats